MKMYRPPSSLLFVLLAVLVVSASSFAGGQDFPNYFTFEGEYLLVLSDADMVPSAYVDGNLGPKTDSMEDRLTVIPLKDGIAGLKPTSIHVSNSVTVWPSNIALDKNNRFAYITEVLEARTDETTSPETFPRGYLVTVVDLKDPVSPVVIQRKRFEYATSAASVSPDGKWLAVSHTYPSDKSLSLVPIGEDGQLGQESSFSYPRDGFADHVEWHPTEPILAAAMSWRMNVLLFKAEFKDGEPSITPWGKPLLTGKVPGVAHWTPDGRHLIVSNIGWHGGVEKAYALNGHSIVSVIRVDLDGDKEGGPQHSIVANAAVGMGAEEFAIHPSGKWIVTLNMHASFYPPEDEALEYYSTMSVLEFDPDREELVNRGDFPFESILPEGITFDKSGDYLAVANFCHYNPQRPTEETTVNFWRFIEATQPRLVQMDVEVPVMRGAHIVKLIP